MNKLIFAFVCIFAVVAGKSIIPTYYAVPSYYPHVYSSQIIAPQQHFSHVIPTVGHVIPKVTLKSADIHTPHVHIPAQHTYHTQDDFGGYSFGYYGGPDSRMETKDAHGNVVGAYNYIDATGKVQSAQYTAGKHGFNIAATNLPVAPHHNVHPVEDTYAVKKAKAEFNKVFQAHKHRTVRTKRDADPAFSYSHSVSAPAVYSVPHVFTAPHVHHKPLTYSAVHHPIPVQTHFKYKTEEDDDDEDKHIVPLTYSAHHVKPQFTHHHVPVVHTAAHLKPVQYSAGVPVVHTAAHLKPVHYGAGVPLAHASPVNTHFVHTYNPMVHGVQYPAGVAPLTVHKF